MAHLTAFSIVAALCGGIAREQLVQGVENASRQIYIYKTCPKVGVSWIG